MKKTYTLFLLGALFSFTTGNAQTGTVTLTPPTGPVVTYASIGAAYAAIPTPLSGNYMIELQTAYDGTSEAYPIQLTDKGLTTGGFGITIRPAAGNNGEIIQRPVAATGVILQLNGGDNVTLDGRPGGVISSTANYLAINDPFAGSNTNRNIELLNAANNNIIQYINCTAADVSSSGAGSLVVSVGATSSTANLNNTIQLCSITGGLRGIQDLGQSDAIPNSGTKILANTVKNFGAIGIFAGTGQSNITINNNFVSMVSYNVPVSGGIVGIQQQSVIAGATSSIIGNTISLAITSTGTTGITGIADVAAGTENIQNNIINGLSAPSAAAIIGIGTYSNGAATFNVIKNTITNLSGPVATAIYGVNIGRVAAAAATTFNYQSNKILGLSSTAAVNARGMNILPPAGSTVNVFNSFISITDANPSAAGIFGILTGNTNGSSYTSNIYYNTVRIGGAQSVTNSASSVGIAKQDANAASVYNQRNNISIMERTGGVTGTSQFIGFLLSSTLGTNTVNYNTYYATDANNGFAAGGWNGSVYRNSELALYKTSANTQEQNSNFANVTFVSATDLHLAPPSSTATTLYGTPIAGVTLDIDNGTRSTTNPFQGADEPGVALPIDLLIFSGVKMQQYNLLQWTTATEQNNKGFDLERSVDGTNFKSLAFIPTKAANGNSVAKITYSFNDEKPLSVKGFYRLKQTDKDDKFTYSAIISINGKAVTQLSIADVYPNPVANSFNLLVNTPVSNKVSIAVLGFSGQPLMQQQRTLTTGTTAIPMNVAALPAGVYTVTVTDLVSQEKVSVRFVK